MSPLPPPHRVILAAASLVTTAALAACTAPEFDPHVTTFAAVSPADRDAALLATSQAFSFGRGAIAEAELDAAGGCPVMVRETRDDRVTFTAPAGGCRAERSGTTYHGVAVAVNAPAGGEGGAGSPAPASPMSILFTDFRLARARVHTGPPELIG